jgi:glycosyltransferase involved in cell wall biosynthesis
MEILLLLIHVIFASLLFGIFGGWTYFLAYMLKSLKLSPSLDDLGIRPAHGKVLKVSVILPARNEEKYIGKCLQTLLRQNYPNYEIVVINDSSTDRTGDIINQLALKSSSILVVNAKPKPEDWVGKNWACYEGYQRATGDVFLFTDADTSHSALTMSLAISYLKEQNLDALTAIPRLVCKDFWTRITLPVLSNFLHSRFSALRVNNPDTKTGYFFGSFYVITRSAYEKVGTHMIVKHELVEDGALGRKVKEENFKMKMVRGEKYVDALWARDFKTLWHGLRRLMISVYSQDKTSASLMTIAVFFLLLEPFLSLLYALEVYTKASNIIINEVLLGINIATIAIIVLANAIQLKFGIFQNPLYALGSPISAAIVSLSFISSLLDAKKIGAVNWRDRLYTIRKNQHPL